MNVFDEAAFGREGTERDNPLQRFAEAADDRAPRSGLHPTKITSATYVGDREMPEGPGNESSRDEDGRNDEGDGDDLPKETSDGRRAGAEGLRELTVDRFEVAREAIDDLVEGRGSGRAKRKETKGRL